MTGLVVGRFYRSTSPLTRVPFVRPGKSPLTVLLLKTSGGQVGQLALFTVKMYCRVEATTRTLS